jgi:hypothetical protein
MSLGLKNALAVLAVTGAAASCWYGRGKVALEEAAPVGGGLAQVRDHMSIDPPRQTLWISDSGPASLKRVFKLGEDTHGCSRIVWRPDGRRVGFLINDVELHLYDLQGTLTDSLPLVEVGGYPGTREARDLAWQDGVIDYLDCARGSDDCASRWIEAP